MTDLPSLTEDIPQDVRREVYARDRFRCRWCGRTHPGWGGYHVHHIDYRSSGGVHEPWNLILLCSGCHKLVHEQLPKEQAQLVLFDLVARTGVTGLAIWRKIRKVEDSPSPPEDEGRVRRRFG